MLGFVDLVSSVLLLIISQSNSYFSALADCIKVVFHVMHDLHFGGHVAVLLMSLSDVTISIFQRNIDIIMDTMPCLNFEQSTYKMFRREKLENCARIYINL